MFFLCSNKYKRKEISSLPRQYGFRKEGRERISLSAFCRGSLTVEAACVLPIFLCGILAFLYFFQAVTMAGKVAEALQDAGKQMAVYAYVKEQALGKEEISASKIVSLIYAKNRINRTLEADAPSVSLMRSSVLKKDGIIDLVAEYKFRWKMPFFSFSDFPILQRARIRAWTGRSSVDNGGNENGESGGKVYVTTNGNVYHKSRDCTHIRLSVRQEPESRVSGLRNVDGGKYHPCEKCGGSGSRIYVTDTGDRYHSSAACSGLKREVIEIPLSQAEGWKACSRCG